MLLGWRKLKIEAQFKTRGKSGASGVEKTKDCGTRPNIKHEGDVRCSEALGWGGLDIPAPLVHLMTLYTCNYSIVR